MKAKIIFNASLLIAIIFTAFGCEKNDVNIFDSDWKVEAIKNPGSSFFQKTKEEYLLIFEPDSTFSLNLDVNHCGGNYVIQGDAINFSPLGCTKICCDSEFAEDLARLVHTTEGFELGGNRLFLYGEGVIQLQVD